MPQVGRTLHARTHAPGAVAAPALLPLRPAGLPTLAVPGSCTWDEHGEQASVPMAPPASHSRPALPPCPAPRSGDVRSGEWSISDGRSLTRFAEGVVLPAKGPQQAGRARQLLLAFNSPNRVQQAAAAAASNAAAAMAGVLPFMGLIPPGIPASHPVAAPINGAAAKPSVFSRLGGKQQEQQRFAPY